LPIQTPLLNSNGNLSLPWILFFNGLTSQVSSASGGSPSYLFTVPGTIGIRSNAAPLIQAPSDETFTSAVALVKTAPTGANISVNILDAGSVLGTVAIVAGKTSGTVAFSAAGVSAGDLLTIDITAVGTTFPGSDLTVQLQP
jgi:hypothetical protein